MKKLLDQVSFRDIMALLLVGSCIGLLVFILIKGLETNNSSQVLTASVGILNLIVGYYFGSSKQTNADTRKALEEAKNNDVNTGKPVE